jgi:hypothetical protein
MNILNLTDYIFYTQILPKGQFLELAASVCLELLPPLFTKARISNLLLFPSITGNPFNSETHMSAYNILPLSKKEWNSRCTLDYNSKFDKYIGKKY